MTKPIRNPRDFAQRALSIVQQATGQVPKKSPPVKNAKAVSRGKLGGIKGGRARANSLSARKRRVIARNAAKARWNQHK